MIDQFKGHIVKRIFEEYATGIYTLSAMLKKAKTWGLRTRNNCDLGKSVLHSMLQNPFYYGEMIVKKEIWSHVYELLITKEIFMKCKEVREGWNKMPFKYGEKDFIFRGILKCAVTGRVVTAETKKKKSSNGTIKEYTYLATWDPKDSTKKLYVREDEIISQIESILGSIGIKIPKY